MEQEQLELKALQHLIQNPVAREKLKRRKTGLRLVMFENSASSKVAEWITRYEAHYRDIPNNKSVLLAFASPHLQSIEEPLNSWCVQLIEQIYQPTDLQETFEFCVDQLAFNWKKRTALRDLETAIRDLHQNQFDEFTGKLSGIIRQIKSTDNVSHINPIKDYQKLVADHQYRTAHPELEMRIPTGIPWLDEVLGGGFSMGEYYILMAYTGRGKSFFGAQVAYYAAMSKFNVVMANLEMSNKKATYRMLSRITGIPYIRFMKPSQMTEENYRTWEQKMKEWEESKERGRLEFISFDKVPTVEDIEAKLEDLGIDVHLLIIDQITNMSSKLEWQELEVIAKKLEWLAKNWKNERGIAILTFGQVKAETRDYRTLTEQHFAYGKPVCEHATGVLYLSQTLEDQTRNVINLGITKNRDAAPTTQQATLYPEFEYSRIHSTERMRREMDSGNVPT